jgi:glycerol-1-phosphate dehydrogenase [NAD(P)+]
MALFEGLAMTGFSMQYMKSSRPVSGCEHLFSHIWEMEDLSFGGAPVTHGHKVALGTLIATAIYERLIARGLDGIDPGEAARRLPSPAEREKAIRERFENSPAAPGAVAAAVGVSLSKLAPRVAEARVAEARGRWPALSKRLEAQLMPYAELKEAFSAAGCPVRAEDIGLSREYAIRTAFRAQMIRDRYSILDLLFDAGILDEVVEEVVARPRYL